MVLKSGEERHIETERTAEGMILHYERLMWSRKRWSGEECSDG